MNERLFLPKTKKEWRIIDSRIKKLGTSNFSMYLIKKITHLIEDYKSHSTEIDNFLINEDNKTVVRQKRISCNFHEELSKISKKTGVPISSIVDKIIITPLLIEK